MVVVKPFQVEQWMDAYETSAVYNLAETCCASISLNELQELSGADTPLSCVDIKRPLTYGHITGSPALRRNLARQYQSASITEANVLITAGAIQANFLSLYTLIGAGDHVICHYPTYQQLYSVPEALGANVTLWRSDPVKGWSLQIDDLKSMNKTNTKMIIINNPQNPTGAVLSGQELQLIIDIAREHGLIVHCDEVYRPLYHTDDTKETVTSLLDLGYERTVVTGSMSKAFSLAGIRVGWLASGSEDILKSCAAARDYTSISVSQIDDQIAAVATSQEVMNKILDRNIRLAVKNKAAVQALIDEFSSICSWIAPCGGTTAMIQIRHPSGELVDDIEFCRALQKTTGTMLVPASHCFGDGQDFVGFVRIGYVCRHEELVEGLEKLRSYLRDHFLVSPPK